MKRHINTLINYIFNNMYFLNNIRQRILSYFPKYKNSDNINIIEVNIYFSQNNSFVKLNSNCLKELQQKLDINKFIKYNEVISLFLKFHDVDFIENSILDIKYKINNKVYKINIDISADNFKFPLYSSIRTNNTINKILFAYIYDTEDNDYEYEITDELEMYQGPHNNFYNDTEYGVLIKNIVKNDGEKLINSLNKNRYILIQDTLLNEYRIDYPFDKKINFINNVDEAIIEETRNNNSVFLNDFLNRGFLSRIKDIVTNFIGNS